MKNSKTIILVIIACAIAGWIGSSTSATETSYELRPNIIIPAMPQIGGRIDGPDHIAGKYAIENHNRLKELSRKIEKLNANIEMLGFQVSQMDKKLDRIAQSVKPSKPKQNILPVSIDKSDKAGQSQSRQGDQQ